MRKIVVALFVAIALIAASGPAFGSDSEIPIPVDVLFMRPVSLAATVFGTAIFVVALPVSIPSGSVKITARKMIVEPFNYTFTRPIGESSKKSVISSNAL